MRPTIPFSKTPIISGAAFDPSSLGLALDLRTPNEVLDTSGLANYNSLIGFRNVEASLDDVAVILDQSQGLTNKSTLYHSNFMSGVDSFVTFTASPTLAGNETFGGESGWLKVTTTATTATARVYRICNASERTRAKVYKCRFKIGIPSSNTTADSVIVGSTDNGVHRPIKITPTQDTIVQSDWFYSYNSGGQDTFVLELKNITAIGESFYIKDIETFELNGNHFIQNTAAAMPHWDNTNFTVDFDGIDDELVDLGGNFFTAVSADTTGTWITVVDDDEGTGTVLNPISFSSISGIDVIEIGRIDSLDKPAFRNLTDAVDTILVYTDSANRSGRNTQILSCDGSSNGTLMYLNGAANALNSGTDNGYWHQYGAVTRAVLDNIRIGSRNGLTFWAFGFRGAEYRTIELTAQERTDLKTWLDANV